MSNAWEGPPKGAVTKAEKKHLAQKAYDCANDPTKVKNAGLANPQNALLYFFFTEGKTYFENKGNINMCRNLSNAAKGVSASKVRLYKVEHVDAIFGVGAMLKKMVIEVLWDLYPPDPPDAAELQAEQEKAALKQQQAMALKQQRKDERAAKRDANKAAARGIQVPAAGATQQKANAASSSQGLAPAEERPPKKQKKEKEKYTPKVGTANYALLLCLYQSYKAGEDYVTKTELVDRAEASGLSNQAIRSTTSDPTNPATFYDGWSNFKRLRNQDPPYVNTWSNPMKVALLPAGVPIAAKLYKDAVDRNKLPDDPNIDYLQDLAPTTTQPSTALKASQPPLAPPPLQPLHAQPKLSPFAPAPLQPLHAQPNRPTLQPTQAVNPLNSLPPFHPRPPSNAHNSRPSTSQPQRYGVPGNRVAVAGAQCTDFTSAGQSSAAQQVRPCSQPLSQPCSAGNAVHAVGEHGQPSAPVTAAEVAASGWQDPPERPEHDWSDSEGEDSTLRVGKHRKAKATQDVTAGARSFLQSQPSSIHPPPNLANLGVTLPGAHTRYPTMPLETIVLDISDDEADITAQPMHTGPADTLAPQPAPLQPGGACSAPSNTDRHRAPSNRHAPTTHTMQPVPQPTVHPSHGHTGVLNTLPGAVPHASAPACPAPAAAKPTPQYETIVLDISDDEDEAPPPVAPPPVGRLTELNLAVPPSSAPPVPPRPPAPLPCPALNPAPSTSARPGPQMHVRPSNGTGMNAAQEQGGNFWQRIERSYSTQTPKGGWWLPLLKAHSQFDPSSMRLPPLTPGRTFDDEYQIVLLVDDRERFGHVRGAPAADRSAMVKRLTDQLERKGVKVGMRHLKSGDCLWVAQRRNNTAYEYCLEHFVERKRVDDLHSSIVSKRYNQQKMWMTRCGLQCPMYLVEGESHCLETTQAQRAVRTAAVQTEVHDGFLVFHTRDFNHTMNLYTRITRCLKWMYGSRSATNSQGAGRLPTYQEVATRIDSSKKLTVRDAWGILLLGVPAVGIEVADLILHHYPTPKSLFQAYQKVMLEARAGGRSPTAEAQQMLGRLRMGATRSIPNQASKNVFDVLFANGWAVDECAAQM